MLVDHADAGGLRLARVAEKLRLAVQRHAAFISVVEAHDAFHQGGFAGTVLTQQSVHAAGADAECGIGQRRGLAEALGEAADFQCGSARGGGALRHGRAASRALDVLTVPKTPPCILIMRMAWRWFAASVAPQQSSSSRHS